MSIASPKVPSYVFTDLFEMYEAQGWVSSHSEALADLWNLCESREEQLMLKALIKAFFILDGKRELEALNAASKMIAEWGLSPNSTWIVAAANAEEVDGGVAALQKLKNKVVPIHSWHNRMLPSIPVASDKVSNGDSVVIFDDFVGTGGKMEKKSNWLKRLAGKNGVTDLKFYYLSLAGMRFGLEQLRGNTGSPVFSCFAFSKAISESFSSAEAAEYKALMLAVESRLSDKYNHKALSDFSLGYGESEALYCAENNNCPNNVFPVFWWPVKKDGKGFRTILYRAG